MSLPTLVVPRGAEAAAVRRAHPPNRIVEIRAGAAAGDLALASDARDRIVVLGLCGALRERRVGDVVVYRSVAGIDGRYACAALDGLVSTTAMPLHLVDACTTDRVVTTAGARRALAARWDADVVDMEGTHVAAALAARGTPCAMVRVVSDDALRDLPALEGAIRSDGGVDVVRIAAAFARQPRAAYAFVRDVRRALRVLGEVARALSAPSP